MHRKPDKKKHSDIRVPKEDIKIEKDGEGFKKTLEKITKQDKKTESKTESEKLSDNESE